ncbi:hypothetical protein D7030_00090 [Flavobacteriaceae bacterium AU392]|nr:hypothetical protein D1817_14345 [Flavobacteriaceae bacterium]RKM86933.1 hypothetical protein D7030_00090 [Flavobacteriaceae bacterium AU392]
MITTYAQEKRIKFNNGTLKICTSSNMKISGYDGDEVIIKSVTNNNYRVLYNNAAFPQKRRSISATGTATFDRKDKDSVLVNNFRYFVNSNDQKKREKGLKPLGNKSTNPADNLYLDINESPGELVIKDFVHSSGNNNTTVSGRVTTFYHYDKYELLVPNSIKLLWNVENCQKTKAKAFVVRSSSNPWQLSDFSGEVEISSSYSGITLTDVTGPTLVNTIGGNIKVIFDKKTPNKLYSLISKDGYIDVELPSNSNLNIDATGDRILSDLDFKISKDEIVDGLKNMKLQLNNGNVKMKLNSGSGSIYLRKGN